MDDMKVRKPRPCRHWSYVELDEPASAFGSGGLFKPHRIGLCRRDGFRPTIELAVWPRGAAKSPICLELGHEDMRSVAIAALKELE